VGPKSSVLDWVERLSALLSSKSGARADHGLARDKPESPHSDMRSRLAQETSANIVGGVVELVGIADIRQRLGRDWDLVAPTVDEIAAAEFERGLGPADIYERTGDGYLICFETSSQDDAKRVADQIARSIERRLVEQAAIAGVRGEARTASLSLPQLRQSGDPVAAMQAALAGERPGTGSARTVPRFVQPSVLYQPAWPRSELGQTQNRCIMDSVSGLAIARQFQEMGQSEDLQEALANLDCSLLGKAIDGLHEAISSIKTATILVPVHFHTLLGAGGLELVSLGASIPTGSRKFVLLDVIGIPASASAAELLQAARTAREVTSGVIAQLHPGDGRFRKGLVDLLWGASLSLGETPEDSIESELHSFVSYCSEVGLRSYAFSANTLGKATAAARAGFDYVSGSAVHDIVSAPRSHARFSPHFYDPAARLRHRGERARRVHTRFVPADPHSHLTLPDGSLHQCLVKEASASGATVITALRPDCGSQVLLGQLPSRVTRHFDNGVAVQFLKLHPPFVVEEALQQVITPKG
jgi:hypothetical protein